MGFLSSLFGLGSSRAQPATSTVVQAQKLPSEIAPFVQEVVGEAQDLYKQRLKEGFIPYEGETIAPLTPQEETAMARIEGLAGTSRPLQEEALGVTRGLAEKFTPEKAQEYMSPYQKAVTDKELREAQTRFEREIRPRFEASAIQAGGLSGLGSRAGVESAELQRGQSQLLADIQAKGLQSAFRDAQQQFAQQKQREAGMAAELTRAGPALFASGLQEAGALQTVGEQRRELAQSALDEAFFESEQARRQPEQTLAEYSGFVYGNPMTQIPTQTQTGTSTPFQPSLGQTLLGGGLQLGGAFLGSRGGSNYFASMLPGYKKEKHGGYISREGGGFIDRDRGLSGLPMFRRQAGGPPVDIWPQGMEDVEIETVPEETPEENPRTAIFKQLAAKAGPFPAQQTPDELTAAGEAKKARRAAVFDKIIGDKGSLKLGDVFIAVGQGLMKGGGLEYSKAFEDLTKKLQKERGDVSQLEAQQLISNLEIDELTDEQIRVLPRDLAAWIASVNKAKQDTEYRQEQIAKLKREGYPKPSKRQAVAVETDSPEFKIYSRQIELLGKSYEKIDPKIGKHLQDLDNATLQALISRALNLKAELGDSISPDEAVHRVVIDAINRFGKTGGKELGREGWLDTIIQEVFD